MKRVLLFLFIIISLPQYLLAQSDPPSGLAIDDEAYEQVEMMEVPDLRGEELPYQKSLKTYCPTPGDQENTESCVGWALAQSLTINKAIMSGETNQKKIDQMAHSASYIYNQIKLGESCRAKAKFKDGFELLRDYGDCLIFDFESSTSACHVKPKAIHHKKAAQYKIQSFKKIFEKDHNIYKKIGLIQFAVSKNQPVLIGMYIPAHFRYSALDKQDWQFAQKYAHAMIVVGYDDLTQQFEVMNSYGTSWGDTGFFKIGYTDLARNLISGYKINLGDQFPLVVRK